jgi:hypothetical protein
MTNNHRYPIWFSDDDYQKLKFQIQSAIMSVLLKNYGDNPSLDKALPKLMHVVELSWKKIRGRNIPIIPKE